MAPDDTTIEGESEHTPLWSVANWRETAGMSRFEGQL